VSEFKDFYRQWKGAIRVTSSVEFTRSIYFEEERDRIGFDVLPKFMEEHGVEWAVLVAAIFERRSALAGRLDQFALAKFRMVFDRHMLNLSKAEFDDAYHASSDERALFLIHQKVPPVRICSALAAAKNASLDMIVENAKNGVGEAEIALMGALSTLFMMELNHVMRVYVYFARADRRDEALFDVIRQGDNGVRFDYKPPTENGQMSFPEVEKTGMMELF